MASPHDAMGHGGHGAMSMADMVRDMRNRFLVALVFTIPIAIPVPPAAVSVTSAAIALRWQ